MQDCTEEVMGLLSVLPDIIAAPYSFIYMSLHAICSSCRACPSIQLKWLPRAWHPSFRPQADVHRRLSRPCGRATSMGNPSGGAVIILVVSVLELQSWSVNIHPPNRSHWSARILLCYFAVLTSHEAEWLANNLICEDHRPWGGRVCAQCSEPTLEG